MISNISLLLILCLAINGCNMDCVEPGLQSRSTSVNVDVPVHKADKIHWVDSGQVISQGEKIKFTLDGSVNFCPLKEDKNPREVLVPAVFCTDGSEPNYSKAANINDVPNNYGVEDIIRHYLETWALLCYCTKIASRLVRTYTDNHSLKELCLELLATKLNKQQQSSDWGNENLTDKQKSYAASDVLYLNKIKEKLDLMLERENRKELAQK